MGGYIGYCRAVQCPIAVSLMRRTCLRCEFASSTTKPIILFTSLSNDTLYPYVCPCNNTHSRFPWRAGVQDAPSGLTGVIASKDRTIAVQGSELAALRQI